MMARAAPAREENRRSHHREGGPKSSADFDQGQVIDINKANGSFLAKPETL